jgi:hypothetical protein
VTMIEVGSEVDDVHDLLSVGCNFGTKLKAAEYFTGSRPVTASSSQSE